MRKSIRPFVLFIVSLLSLSACHSDSNLHGFDYNFENLTDKPININIYKTLSDYYTQSNVFLTARMEVRGYYSVPIDQFVSGQTYYVDWYSDDLLYTNWFWSNITLRTAFKVSYNDYEYLVNTVQYPDPSRNIWMNGLNTRTTWKAVDAYNVSGTNYTSIWSQLSNAQQNVHLVLNKDFSAHLLLQDANNQTIDSALTYRADYANNISTITLLNFEDTVGTVMSNFNPSAHTFNGDNGTMLANIRTMGYYQMQRQ